MIQFCSERASPVILLLSFPLFQVKKLWFSMLTTGEFSWRELILCFGANVVIARRQRSFFSLKWDQKSHASYLSDESDSEFFVIGGLISSYS